MKNKRILAGIIAATLITGNLSCIPVSAENYSSTASISASSVQLNTSKMELTKGYGFTLKVSGAAKAVKFYSSNPDIATVSSKGKVVGKQPGKVTVYASYEDELLPCEVTVVATKITSNKKSISVNPGEKDAVTITVKGVKNVKADSLDKNIATVSWGNSWNGNDVKLNIKGMSAGTTKIKLYNPNYPEVYKVITVNVGTNNNSSSSSGMIASTKKSIEMKSGETETFKVSSTVPLSIASSNTNVIVPSITKKNGFYEVTVSSVSAGSALVTIYETGKPSNCVTIPAKVEGNSGITINPHARYYVEKTYNLVNPSSNKIEVKNASDKIAYYADEGTCQLKYMIVPYNYVSDNDSVYTVRADELVSNMILTNYPDRYPFFFNDYLCGQHTVRYYDIAHPLNNQFKMNPADKFAWTIASNGTILYSIVPYNAMIDYDKFDYVLNADGTAFIVRSDYYRITTALPRKKMSSDRILTWPGDRGEVYYMLVPSEYDSVKAETAAARFTGHYEYYTIYSSRPSKQMSSDIIISYYNEKSDSDRYILVPRNYNENRVDRLKEKDLAREDVSTVVSDIKYITDSINAERRKCGISELDTDDKALEAAASKRVKELTERYSHKRPDGSSYKTALEEAGVIFSRSNEIIFKNKEFAYQVIDAIFEDEDYRDIVLSSLNDKMAIAYDSTNDYYVLIFTD